MLGLCIELLRAQGQLRVRPCCVESAVVVRANLLSWLSWRFFFLFFPTHSVTGHFGSSQSWALFLTSSSCSIDQMYLQASVLALSADFNLIPQLQMSLGVWMQRAVGTFDARSACSIPVHHQSKPEIEPSRMCADVFSCPLTDFLPVHLSPVHFENCPTAEEDTPPPPRPPASPPPPHRRLRDCPQ